jgi:hypothetical protein
MKRGDIATRMQCTARLLITPPGGGALVNLGDMDGHKRTMRRESAPVTIAEKGFRREIRGLTSLIAEEWEFTLNEQFNQVIELGLFGTKGNDTTQTLIASPTGTFSFTGVKQGYSYLIGKYDLEVAFIVTGKVLDIDYNIDLGSGELYIIPGGGIGNGSNISGTYGCAARTFENYTSFDRAGQQSGACEIHEFDQHDATGVPLRITTGNFQYWIEGTDEHDGKKPSKRTIKLLATGKPVVKVRA